MSVYVTPQILQNGLSSLTMCHHIPTHLPSSLTMCVITSLQNFPHSSQCASSHPYKSSLIPYNVHHHIPTNLPSSSEMCKIISLQIFPNPLQCASSHPYKSSLIPYNVHLYNPSHPYKPYRSHSAHPDEVCDISTAEGRS